MNKKKFIPDERERILYRVTVMKCRQIKGGERWTIEREVQGNRADKIWKTREREGGGRSSERKAEKERRKPEAEEESDKNLMKPKRNRGKIKSRLGFWDCLLSSRLSQVFCARNGNYSTYMQVIRTHIHTDARTRRIGKQVHTKRMRTLMISTIISLKRASMREQDANTHAHMPVSFLTLPLFVVVFHDCEDRVSFFLYFLLLLLSFFFFFV